LVRPHGVLGTLGMPLCLVVVVVWVVERHGRYWVDLGAEQTQQINLALRLRVGHVDDETIAFTAAHMRQADARVSRRALDNGSAWAQLARLFCCQYNMQRSTILDAATRILKLGLAQYLAACLFRKALETYQRRFADCLWSLSLEVATLSDRDPPSMKPPFAIR
jgi:hypothetical protein